MAAICGMLGNPDRETVKAMVAALKHRGDARHWTESSGHILAGSESAGGVPCVVDGSPWDHRGDRLTAGALLEACNGTPATVRKAGLEGPFATVMAIAENKWRLFRDCLGRRPLYYYEGPDYLLFASELKALLATGRIPRRLNLQAVDRYLTLRCVPGPESIVQDIRRVQPGRFLEYDGASLREQDFAQVPLTERALTREEAAGHVRDLMRDALDRSQCDALLWSGGLDCTALAVLKPTLRPVHVTLSRTWQTDGRQARETARKLGKAVEPAYAPKLTEQALLDAVYYMDEPLADASVFPLWLMGSALKKQGDLFLTGHGADELLGGYPRYHFLDRARGARGLVPVNLLSGILPALPPNAFVRRWSRYLAAIQEPLDAFMALISVFDAEERADLYTETMKSGLGEQSGVLPMFAESFESEQFARNVFSLDLRIGLPDLLLTKCDRMMAAHGVTLEYPYLADSLIRFVAQLPPEVKFGVRAKPLLRMAMKGLVPPHIRQRARRGFRIPEEGPVARIIDNAARQIITPERVDASGLFKWHYVEKVLHGATHNVYRRRQFWALFMFFAWYKQYMEK